MRLLGQVGSFSKVSFNQAAGSRPLSLAVPSKLWMAAARLPARSDPAKSQFFLPMAMGRIQFSVTLLSIGRWPVLAYRINAGQRFNACLSALDEVPPGAVLAKV